MKKILCFILSFVLVVSGLTGIDFGLDSDWTSANELVKDTQVAFTLQANTNLWYKIKTTLPGETIKLLIDKPEGGYENAVYYNIYSETDLQNGNLKNSFGGPTGYIEGLLRSDESNYKLPQEGTYYIKIWSNGNILTPFQIKYTTVSPDAYENNDKWQNATGLVKNTEMAFKISSSSTANINSRDNDWFKFVTTSSGETVKLSINNPDGNDYKYGLYFAVYSGVDLQNGIENNSYGGTGNQYRIRSYESEIKLDVVGTYYIKVWRGSSENPITIKSSLGFPGAIIKMISETDESKETNITGYIYDSTDQGAGITFDIQQLKQVTDLSSAQSAIEGEITKLTIDQKSSATGIDLVTLLAEEALAFASSKMVTDSSITINHPFIESISPQKDGGKSSIESTLVSNGINTAREISSTATIVVPDSNKIEFTLDQSTSSLGVDHIRVQTNDFSISMASQSVKANVDTSDFTVTVTSNSSGFAFEPFTKYEICSLELPRIMLLAGTNTSSTAKTYTVTFNKPLKETAKLSLPAVDGDTNYQAVFNSKGEIIGGKFNPATGMIDVKIQSDGTFFVKENTKSFSDIASKSKEMQKAIKVLSAKGIIGGTSSSTFSPDQPITRAQIAQLLTKTLSMYNPNENGVFSDVKQNDWFYGAAGSAKKNGLMSGTSLTIFAPNKNIPKDQIVVVAASVLKLQMKYKQPGQIDQYLKKYSDKNELANWSLSDLALATKENLVVYRTDGKFMPTSQISRGDAAVILYRLFNKIW